MLDISEGDRVCRDPRETPGRVIAATEIWLIVEIDGCEDAWMRDECQIAKAQEVP